MGKCFYLYCKLLTCQWRRRLGQKWVHSWILWEWNWRSDRSADISDHQDLVQHFSSWSVTGCSFVSICDSCLILPCSCFPQGGQHQYPQQPAVQDGAVRQQPGEPGGGADSSLSRGEEKSWKPPLSNFTTVRKKPQKKNTITFALVSLKPRA